ncbi:MAG: rhodanese-like domain-containing protein [Desulfobacteraceae bacterium]|nr:rhodanese-like domain-containing protein [Desulfobacteraceae bacterium]
MKIPVRIRRLLYVFFGITALGLSAVFWFYPADRDEPSGISGRLVGGYRILDVENTPDMIDFRVYRGDYIKFKPAPPVSSSVLKIPDLGIAETLDGDVGQAPYFKMKKRGTYPFTLGSARGRITVVEFDRPNYSAVSATQAAELINNIRPLVLDVRTKREYDGGHLENSLLIPVQELQHRVRELNGHKDEDILIYCATGNRSTVASKILLDNGFKRIYNMRDGIVEWGGKKLPIAQ